MRNGNCNDKTNWLIRTIKLKRSYVLKCLYISLFHETARRHTFVFCLAYISCDRMFSSGELRNCTQKAVTSFPREENVLHSWAGTHFLTFKAANVRDNFFSLVTSHGDRQNQCILENLSASGDSELARGAAITFRLECLHTHARFCLSGDISAIFPPNRFFMHFEVRAIRCHSARARSFG